jgi:hypothetical protein
MKRSTIHVAVAAAFVFGLAACGGGGGSDPVGNPDPAPTDPGNPTDPGAPGGPGNPPDPDVATKAVTGAVGPAAAGATVCLDGNRNLACDTGEWSTVVAAGGGYTLDVPEDTVLAESLIVGQFAAESAYGASGHNDMVPVAPFTLATPASDTSGMGALSTLAAIRLQADPSLTPEQAMQQVRTDLGLPADLSGVDPAEIARLEAAALPALRQAANAKYLASGSTDLGAATVAAAPSVEKEIRKYIDPTTLALWALVGEKTLVSEAVSDAAPQSCGIHPVETMRIVVTDPPGDNIYDPTDLSIVGGAVNYGKEPYRDAIITIDPGPTYPEGLTTETEIKGRGNTTWRHFDYIKKPYRLRLPRPGLGLLGMPEARNWALLANHSDKSGLRNAIAFCLGKQMNLAFSHPWRFVEVYLNDEYQGVYQLTAHTEAHENRVDIGPVWPEEDEFTPGAGYLLEMDARAPIENEVWFWSEGISPTDGTDPQRPYAIKSDTVDDPHDAATAAVKAQYIAQAKTDIDAMEAAFLEPDPATRLEKAAQLVDLEEFADFYLINEYLRNGDAFWSSTYVHKRGAPGSKLKFGPLWDFDLSAGNDDGLKSDDPADYGPGNDNGNWCPQGWFTRWVSSDYVWPMVQVPEFQRLLEARWQYLSSRLPELWTWMDQARENMADAQARNFGPGAKADLNVRVWPNWVVLPTYEGEVDYLKQWLQARATWMDAAITSGVPDYSVNTLCDPANPSGWIAAWNPGWSPGTPPGP